MAISTVASSSGTYPSSINAYSVTISLCMNTETTLDATQARIFNPSSLVDDEPSFSVASSAEIRSALESGASPSEVLVDMVEKHSYIAMPKGSGIDPSDWMLWNGRYTHKATICRVVVTGWHERKSMNRIERVRTFTDFRLQIHEYPGKDLPSQLLLTLNDTVLALLQSERKLALALIRVTAIRDSTDRYPYVPIASVTAPSSRTVVDGQIMLMRRVTRSYRDTGASI